MAAVVLLCPDKDRELAASTRARVPRGAKEVLLAMVAPGV
jgi:hypothetical protein